MTSDIITTGFVPLIGTFLGALFAVVLPERTPLKVQRVLYGFVGGYFVSAAYWSAMEFNFVRELERDHGSFGRPIALFFLTGFVLLPALSTIVRFCRREKEGTRVGLRKTTKLLIAVAFFCFFRGVAVVDLDPSSISASAYYQALQTMRQNLLLGAIVAVPLRFAGFSRVTSVLFTTLAGASTAIATPTAYCHVEFFGLTFPYFVFFSVGVMFWLVAEVCFSKRAWDDYFSISALLAAFFAAFVGVAVLPDTLSF